MDNLDGQTRTLLVVEDEWVLAATISNYFQEEGYNVLTASDAQAAIRHLTHNRVDVVVSDIRMPGAMNGIGLAKWIRQQLPGVRVVMMSGCTNAADIEEQLGPSVAFFAKPFEVDKLWTAVAGLDAPAV